ncbi:unnamed protein product, partial [Mesorhabditis belari]|uniref:G-protein coupled receptors family 3 profile domain-containing protein n=1 Tax=Mesorhabditis belari TaxID=2138241 RepID=A0AAF3EDF8_9BILA
MEFPSSHKKSNGILTALDGAASCGAALTDVEPLLVNPITEQHPRLVPLASFFAQHPHHNFDGHLEANASRTKENPLPNITFTEKTPVYALQYQCDGLQHRWIPTIVFQMRPESTSTSTSGGYLVVRLEPFDLNLCNDVSVTECNTKCSWTVQGGVRVLAKACCDAVHQKNTCREDSERGRSMLLLFNAGCALACILLIPVVMHARRTQHEGRGWALMELFLLGASVLYSILLLDWLAPAAAGCCAAVWLRQIGFSIFYGSIVLKIYRNLQEYRVRKAQHVSVREQDMLKYLSALLALTITGLIAWTVGSWGDAELWRTAWPQCTIQSWSLIWHCYELLFLFYGMRLCFKARNSDWLERWQFTVAVCLEAVATLMANLIRYSVRNSAHSDTLFTITFVQLQLTVSVNIVIIIAPKFYLVSGESTRRSLAVGQSARAHPSLAKLRDNILNGTIDFAEVPIVDMNPEDIRAELKRVYTQLRMYKLKNLYQDNPHISKKRGGKKWSDKSTAKAAVRRMSIGGASGPTVGGVVTAGSGGGTSPARSRIEEDEKSDLTVESAPHNVYLNKLNLESNCSVRV